MFTRYFRTTSLILQSPKWDFFIYPLKKYIINILYFLSSNNIDEHIKKEVEGIGPKKLLPTCIM